MAQLTIKQTAQVMMSANTDAAKIAGKITIGNVINDRVAKLLIPKLPFMVRAVAESNPVLVKALIANSVSAGLIHFAPTNKKASLAADAMITAAMVDFAASFNIEEMINSVLDGINLDSLVPAVEAPVGA